VGRMMALGLSAKELLPEDFLAPSDLVLTERLAFIFAI